MPMSKTLSRKFEKRFNWVQGCWIAAQWLLIGNGIITLCNLGEELVYLYKRFGFGIVVRIMTRDKQLIASPEFSITIGKSQFTERVDGGTVMLEAISKFKTGDIYPIGRFKGFDLLVEKNYMGVNYMVLRGKTEYKAELSTSPVGNMVKLENTFNGLSENEEFLIKKIDQYQRDMEQSKQEYEKPFSYETELKEKLARQFALNAELDLENSKVEDVDLNGVEGKDNDVPDSNVAERGNDYLNGQDNMRR